MFGQAKPLLIDIGNTFVKAAWLQQGELLPLGVIAIEEMSELLPSASSLWIACVGTPDTADEWVTQAGLLGIPARCLKTEIESFGVRCAYPHIDNLGVDRWLSLLAVEADESRPFAVINVGTAATVDLVHRKQHVGGWIAPGFDLMRNALTEKTQRVFGNSEYPQTLAWGTDTPECVNAGCLAALQGLLLITAQRLQCLSADHAIYISGGGAALLTEITPDMGSHSVHRVENLVLKGIARFAQDAT